MHWISLGLVVLLSACASNHSTNNQPPSNPQDLCVIFGERPHWRDAVEQASDKWQTPVPLMMAFIHQESKFQANAQAPSSDAYGFPQAKDATWRDYQQRTGKSSAERDEFADAVDFIGWYVDGSTQVCRISRQDVFRQYLAYHEGRGGYQRNSYNRKPWLLKVARKVETRSQTYKQQWNKCR